MSQLQSKQTGQIRMNFYSEWQRWFIPSVTLTYNNIEVM